MLGSCVVKAKLVMTSLDGRTRWTEPVTVTDRCNGEGTHKIYFVPKTVRRRRF